MAGALIAPKLPKGYHFKVVDSKVAADYVIVYLKKKYFGFIPLAVNYSAARANAHDIQQKMQFLKEKSLVPPVDKQLLGCYPPKTTIG